MILLLLSSEARYRARKREKDRDCCPAIAFFRTARDRDLAASPLHKLSSDPKSDACSKVTLGRKEGFENPFQMLLLDPAPTVPDHGLNSVS